MKVSIFDLLVISDSLYGSLRIKGDGEGLFSYNRQTREQVLRELHQKLNEIEIKIDVNQTDSSESPDVVTLQEGEIPKESKQKKNSAPPDPFGMSEVKSNSPKIKRAPNQISETLGVEEKNIFSIFESKLFKGKKKNGKKTD